MAEALAIIGVSWLLSKTLPGLKHLSSSENQEKKRSLTDIDWIHDITPNEIGKELADAKIPVLLYSDFHNQETMSRTEQNEDDLREYKDLCTDIVVKLFLASEKSRFYFLKLVYDTFYQSIETYKKEKGLGPWDIFIVYKGGNVLRIVSNDFLKELPGVAFRNINRYYEPFFRRSDADFSIYVNPKLEQYDLVFSQMTVLSYLLQIKIRHEFESNLTRYFDFHKYTKQYQELLLEPYAEQMKQAKCLTDPNNKTFYQKKFDGLSFGNIAIPDDFYSSYEGNVDRGIQFVNENDLVKFSLSSGKHEMYIQANETLDFSSSTGRTKFSLVRTKLNFNIRIDGKAHLIGGELIDVSLPHRYDQKLVHFFEHKSYIVQYELDFSEQDKFRFWSYTLEYMISDLEYILFDFVPLPWETPKYEKRLNRLFFFYYIDLFTKVHTNVERKTVLHRLLQTVFKQKIQTVKEANQLTKTLASLRLPKDLELTKLIKQLERIVKLLVSKGMMADDLTAFQEMMSVLVQNTEFSMSSFEGINQYCSRDGNINMKILYENDFSSLNLAASKDISTASQDAIPGGFESEDMF